MFFSRGKANCIELRHTAFAHGCYHIGGDATAQAACSSSVSFLQAYWPRPIYRVSPKQVQAHDAASYYIGSSLPMYVARVR